MHACMHAAVMAGWYGRALLGLRAREIHLCGGPEAIDVVTRLCQATGDHLEVGLRIGPGEMAHTVYCIWHISIQRPALTD